MSCFNGLARFFGGGFDALKSSFAFDFVALISRRAPVFVLPLFGVEVGVPSDPEEAAIAREPKSISVDSFDDNSSPDWPLVDSSDEYSSLTSSSWPSCSVELEGATLLLILADGRSAVGISSSFKSPFNTCCKLTQLVTLQPGYLSSVLFAFDPLRR